MALLRRIKSSHRVPTTASFAFVSSLVPKTPKGAELLLFSHKICPYCCKTTVTNDDDLLMYSYFELQVIVSWRQALLRFLGIPFAEQEVSPLTKSLIKWSADYKKVPIAVFADGKVVNDSAVIIDEILKRFKPNEVDANFNSAEAQKWSAWSTATLAVMMYPNITRTFAECRQTLAYFGGPFSRLLKQ